MDTHVAMTVLVQLAWFFKLEIGFTLLVAGLALGLIDPGAAQGIPHRVHITMAILAEDSFGEVHIALTIGLEAGVAGVAGIAQ